MRTNGQTLVSICRAACGSCPRVFAHAAWVGLAAIGVCWSPAHAAIIGPYAADANTMHLYHFDESSGAFADSGYSGFTHYDLTDTGGVDGRDGNSSNGGGYNAAAYTGFGTGFDVLKSGDGTQHAEGNIYGGGASTTGTVSASDLQGSDGAFTVECLIKVSSITDEQYPTTPNKSWDRNVVIAGGNLYFANADINAAIPTTGINAWSADTWYHMAVTYSGAEGVADNVKLYWTKVGSSATEANLIGTATASSDFASASGTMTVGSSANSSGNYRELEGQIDELRISSVARGADEFIFAVPEPSSMVMSVAAGFLALLAYAWRKRRSSR